jgi:hypothetical protein
VTELSSNKEINRKPSAQRLREEKTASFTGKVHGQTIRDPSVLSSVDLPEESSMPNSLSGVPAVTKFMQE